MLESNPLNSLDNGVLVLIGTILPVNALSPLGFHRISHLTTKTNQFTYFIYLKINLNFKKVVTSRLFRSEWTIKACCKEDRLHV